MSVMNELIKGPETGYSLISLITKEDGKKPSSGSMYPLLRQLEEDLLIKSKKDGRKVIYSITAKGKRSISKLISEKKKFIEKHIEICKAMNEITGMKTKSENLIPKSDINILRNIDLLHVFKENLLRIVSKDKERKLESKLRKVLRETNQKLKKIK